MAGGSGSIRTAEIDLLQRRQPKPVASRTPGRGPAPWTQPTRRSMLVPMLTPIVTEVPRAIEPVVDDTFISEFADQAPREQDFAENVVRLSAHRSRRHQPALMPARVA